MRYTKQIVIALAGGAVFTMPWLIKLPGQIITYAAQTKLEAEARLAKEEVNTTEEVQRHTINQKKETLKLSEAAGDHVKYLHLKLPNYKDSHVNPNPPTDRYSQNDEVYVVDKNGACVGRIRKGKWEWKRWYQNACG